VHQIGFYCTDNAKVLRDNGTSFFRTLLKPCLN